MLLFRARYCGRPFVVMLSQLFKTPLSRLKTYPVYSARFTGYLLVALEQLNAQIP
jgi:hypothetical protein